VDFLPSPADLPAVVGEWEGREERRAPSDDEPLSALAFKVQADRHMGKFTYVRIYSGILRTGDVVFNATRGLKQRVGRLFEVHADKRDIVDELRAGDVGAVVGLSDTYTGDTLCDERYPLVLEPIEFPSPVLDLAIAPAKREDLDRLSRALAYLSAEDPTFVVRSDDETGEVVISGMGELHLEIIVDRIRREFGVDRCAPGSLPGDGSRICGTRAQAGEADRRPRSVRPHRVPARARGPGRGVPVREPGHWRSDPQGVHPRHQEGVHRCHGRGAVRGLPHGGPQGHPPGRFLPRGGLLGAGLPGLRAARRPSRPGWSSWSR